jgi:hypothetical protein
LGVGDLLVGEEVELNLTAAEPLASIEHMQQTQLGALSVLETDVSVEPLVAFEASTIGGSDSDRGSGLGLSC